MNSESEAGLPQLLIKVRPLTLQYNVEIHCSLGTSSIVLLETLMVCEPERFFQDQTLYKKKKPVKDRGDKKQVTSKGLRKDLFIERVVWLWGLKG